MPLVVEGLALGRADLAHPLAFQGAVQELQGHVHPGAQGRGLGFVAQGGDGHLQAILHRQEFAQEALRRRT